MSLPIRLKNSVTPRPDAAILRFKEDETEEALDVLRSSVPVVLGVVGVVLARGVSIASSSCAAMVLGEVRAEREGGVGAPADDDAGVGVWV